MAALNVHAQWFMRLRRSIEKNRNGILGLALRGYPGFVLSDQATALTEIPAFEFHDVHVAMLEPLLMHISNNGYRTLTADEYIARQVTAGPDPDTERAVLLTFDDGRKSLYKVAYPMLRRLGMTAVAYVVPGWVAENSRFGCGQLWRESLCTWPELREMHDNRAVDVQSHSMHHHTIAVSPAVVDFVRPGLSLNFVDSDLALAPLELNGPDTQASLGTPIGAWRTRYASAPAFHEDPAVISACVAYVARRGGPAFFGEPDWAGELRAVLANARRTTPGGVFETPAEQRQALLDDLLQSRLAIERRLPGKEVRHFCFPWFQGSSIAARLSWEAGYISNAWGSLVPRFARGGRAPVPIRRLPPQYIWRLPGAGRRSLGSVLQDGVLARLKRACATS